MKKSYIEKVLQKKHSREKGIEIQHEQGLDIADFFIQNKKLLLGNSEIYNKLKAKNSNLEKLLEIFDLVIPYD